MMKKCRFAVIFLLSILLVSCGGGRSSLKDGYYSAIAADWDAYGWKEFITICVSDGIITTVEYNAVNQGGYVKSWDTEYMRAMKAVSGVYPHVYTRYYAAELIRTQGEGAIDVLTGATDSWNCFRQLTVGVLEHARRGDGTMALVPMEPLLAEEERAGE
ncbi:MAG: FMN-binding protein [Spirochaetaceae bacterium]|nr:FMN-binding protein [Spirochaetaceae bacterium]